MEHHGTNLLEQLVTTAHQQNRLPQFFRLMFRAHELGKFENRAAILRGLMAGQTYEEIREQLGVGVDTIARMSLVLEGNREVVEELFTPLGGGETDRNSSLGTEIKKLDEGEEEAAEAPPQLPAPRNIYKFG